MIRSLLLAALVAVPIGCATALANDSMAELRTNGLIFVQTGTVSMKKEDLFISADEVRVDYVFENTGDKDEKTLVAFPMPDIEGNPFVPTAIPDDTNENFLDFTVAVDGKIVEPKIDMRASVVGIDVTDELKSRGVPLFPFGDAAYAATDALPDDVKLDMARRGILVLDEFDQGQGMEKHYRPYWTLRTTYWWEMTFPAGKEVIVQHRYKPSVGGTAGVTFVQDGKLAGETYETYKQRYCFDAGFEKAFLETVTADNPYGPFMESRIAYVLTTGQNWAGPIGDFHLTIDKGNPKNLLSFCGEGVEKTGPTTFEMSAKDFYPTKDLDILILTRQEEAQ